MKHFLLMTDQEYDQYKQANEIIHQLMEKVKQGEMKATVNILPELEVIHFINYMNEDTQEEFLIWLHQQLGFKLNEKDSLSEMIERNTFTIMRRDRAEQLLLIEDNYGKMRTALAKANGFIRFFLKKVFKKEGIILPDRFDPNLDEND